MDTGYKCTLALDVEPVRADGYHPVDGVLVRLGGGDALRIVPSTAATVTIRGMADTPDNLVRRALTAIAAVVGDLPPLAVTLEKRVPVGAGLGGGSADAGTVIQWAMVRWPRHADALRAAAAQLGMDVPFFVEDYGAARVGGYGERVAPLPAPARGALIVAWPGFSVSTAAVYKAYDKVGPGEAPAASRVAESLAAGTDPPRIGNQLERAAILVEPRLADFRRALEDAGCAPDWTALSGSGSAYVAWFPSAAAAYAVAARVARWARWVRVGCWDGVGGVDDAGGGVGGRQEPEGVSGD
jgi:4-diphosphocytidyl-2-C-methyl-D-erythritol kinase